MQRWPWAVLAVPLLLGVDRPRVSTEKLYESSKDAVYTIEVHTGNRGSKSVSGSGYLVSEAGDVITNYHVVSTYIAEPERHFIRLRNETGEYQAELVSFDFASDLARLRMVGKPPTLPLVIDRSGGLRVGAPVVSLGNPHGIRLSIIKGIFNGYAEKGLIDRMLFSMPLNSGMSGGPILSSDGKVIGTNVSVIWLSNSVSFGVPASKLVALLEAPALPRSRDAYGREAARQLRRVEQQTFDTLRTQLGSATTETIQLGRASFSKPPAIFSCWDSSKVHSEQGVTGARYSCDLQFTPILGSDAVASVELSADYLSSAHGRYGFYGIVSSKARAMHESDETNDELIGPRCTWNRVQVGSTTWKIDTCLSALVNYKSLYNVLMTAASVDRPNEAVVLSLRLRAFRLSSFEYIAKYFLNNLTFGSSG